MSILAVRDMLMHHGFDGFLGIFRPGGPENHEPRISLTVAGPAAERLSPSELEKFDNATDGAADIAFDPRLGTIVVSVTPEPADAPPGRPFWSWVPVLRFFAREEWLLRILCAESR